MHAPPTSRPGPTLAGGEHQAGGPAALVARYKSKLEYVEKERNMLSASNRELLDKLTFLGEELSEFESVKTVALQHHEAEENERIRRVKLQQQHQTSAAERGDDEEKEGGSLKSRFMRFVDDVGSKKKEEQEREQRELLLTPKKDYKLEYEKLVARFLQNDKLPVELRATQNQLKIVQTDRDGLQHELVATKGNLASLQEEARSLRLVLQSGGVGNNSSAKPIPSSSAKKASVAAPPTKVESAISEEEHPFDSMFDDDDDDNSSGTKAQQEQQAESPDSEQNNPTGVEVYIQQLQSELDEFRSRRKQMDLEKMQLDKMKETDTRKSKELADCRAKLQATATETAGLQNQVTRFVGIVAEYEETIERQKHDLDAVKQEFVAAGLLSKDERLEFDTAVTERAQLKIQLEQIQNESEITKKHSEDVVEENKVLRKHLAECRSKNELLSQQMASLKSSFQVLEMELEARELDDLGPKKKASGAKGGHSRTTSGSSNQNAQSSRTEGAAEATLETTPAEASSHIEVIEAHQGSPKEEVVLLQKKEIQALNVELARMKTENKILNVSHHSLSLRLYVHGFVELSETKTQVEEEKANLHAARAQTKSKLEAAREDARKELVAVQEEKEQLENSLAMVREDHEVELRQAKRQIKDLKQQLVAMKTTNDEGASPSSSVLVTPHRGDGGVHSRTSSTIGDRPSMDAASPLPPSPPSVQRVTTTTSTTTGGLPNSSGDFNTHQQQHHDRTTSVVSVSSAHSDPFSQSAASSKNFLSPQNRQISIDPALPTDVQDLQRKVIALQEDNDRKGQLITSLVESEGSAALQAFRSKVATESASNRAGGGTSTGKLGWISGLKRKVTGGSSSLSTAAGGSSAVTGGHGDMAATKASSSSSSSNNKNNATIVGLQKMLEEKLSENLQLQNELDHLKATLQSCDRCRVLSS